MESLTVDASAVLDGHCEPRANTQPHRVRGVVLATISMLVTAPDGVLVFELHEEVADQSATLVVLWKWLVVSLICGLSGILQLKRGSDGNEMPLVSGIGRDGWLHLGFGTLGIMVASLYTLGLMFSVPSVAIMLFYLNPLWAVLFDAVALGRHVPQRTVIALFFAMAAVALPAGAAIVAGDASVERVADLDRVEPDVDLGAPSHLVSEVVVGFLLSLVAGTGYAGFLTACRSASMKCAHVPMVFTVFSGNVLVVCISFAILIMEGATIFPCVARFWWLLAADALCVGLGTVLLPYAAKYLDGGEHAMILLGEIAASQLLLTVTGVEQAETVKVCGGACLIMVLVFHEWASSRAVTNNDLSASIGGAASATAT